MRIEDAIPCPWSNTAQDLNVPVRSLSWIRRLQIEDALKASFADY